MQELTDESEIKEYDSLMQIWDCLKSFIADYVWDDVTRRCGVPGFMPHGHKTDVGLNNLRLKLPRDPVIFLTIFRDVVSDLIPTIESGKWYWDATRQIFACNEEVE